MSRAWLWVLIGGMFETVWAVFMKMSEGFTVIPYTVLTLVFLAVSAIFLNKGLKAGLPVGPAYAVWVGIGAVMSVVASVLVFGENLNLIGYGFLALIICGIVGLNLVTEDE